MSRAPEDEVPVPPTKEVRVARWSRRRILLVGVGIVLLAFVFPAWSFGRAVTRSNGDPFSVKATEWARDHQLGWLVDRTEHFWYSRHQPPIGGTPKGGIPKVGTPADATSHAGNRAPSAPAPACGAPPLKPVVASPLPGEGSWQAAGRSTAGVCFAYLRPDAVHTSVVVGLAWMDMHRLTATLHNGTDLPGGNGWRAGSQISPSDYPRVAAAFNGGFRLDTSDGGYFTEGRTVKPLVDGRASLVILTNGRIGVGMWGRDYRAGPTIASVRQNLDLLVDNGQLVPGLGDASSHNWGATLGNKIYTWRSGVGVDAHGNVVYVGGPGLNVQTLADLLQRAGSVRAMELDINPHWVTLMAYTGNSPATITATKLLNDMQRPADRYLQNGTRDFVELDLRR